MSLVKWGMKAFPCFTAKLIHTVNVVLAKKDTARLLAISNSCALTLSEVADEKAKALTVIHSGVVIYKEALLKVPGPLLQQT